MIANYGYGDASGDYYISIDTSKCNGCGECVRVCTPAVLAIVEDDYGQNVATVREMHRKRLRYSCSPCKPLRRERTLPCVANCECSAISHSW